MRKVLAAIANNDMASLIKELELLPTLPASPSGEPLVFLALAQGHWAIARELSRRSDCMRGASPAGMGAWSALLAGRCATEEGWDLVLEHGPGLAWVEPATGHQALHLLAAHHPFRTDWMDQAVGSGCRWFTRAGPRGRRPWDLLPPTLRAARIAARRYQRLARCLPPGTAPVESTRL